eukprot:362450-Chlamydomonas_euryale.AAC.3
MCALRALLAWPAHARCVGATPAGITQYMLLAQLHFRRRQENATRIGIDFDVASSAIRGIGQTGRGDRIGGRGCQVRTRRGWAVVCGRLRPKHPILTDAFFIKGRGPFLFFSLCQAAALAGMRRTVDQNTSTELHGHWITALVAK